RRRQVDLRRQLGLPASPRRARALRRGERARTAGRPAAAQLGRLALPHPADAVPPHRHARGAARRRGQRLQGGRRRPPRRPDRPPLPARRGPQSARGPPGPAHDRQAGPHSVTPFGDLQAFQDLPRPTGLALSPDGTRLVTTVAVPDPKRSRFRTALWEVDPTGARPARRLTRGTGEAAPVFLPDGSLLFTSARLDPEREEPAEDAPAALWRLPPAGEAHVVGTRAGGIGPPVVACAAGTVVVGAKTLPAPSPTRTTRPGARPARTGRSAR